MTRLLLQPVGIDTNTEPDSAQANIPASNATTGKFPARFKAPLIP